MNEITNIQANSNIRSPQTVQKTDSSDLFQETLDNALRGEEIPETNPSPTLGEIRTATFSPVEHDSQSSPNAVAEKTDALISLLDQYSESLNNPATSLREIAPLISTIKSSAQELMQETTQMLEADDQLQEIAMQCAVMANVEHIKFERGDYL